jgi:hypothetical protein
MVKGLQTPMSFIPAAIGACVLLPLISQFATAQTAQQVLAWTDGHHVRGFGQVDEEVVQVSLLALEREGIRHPGSQLVVHVGEEHASKDQ